LHDLTIIIPQAKKEVKGIYSILPHRRGRRDRCCKGIGCDVKIPFQRKTMKWVPMGPKYWWGRIGD
jgi:hypothetical protein